MSKKKTHEGFLWEAYALVKDEYTVLGKYEGAKTKILMQHNNCGCKYEVSPGSFLRGIRCPKCFGTPRKTIEQFVKEVLDKYQSEYVVLGEYKTNWAKILMKHTKCDHTWETTPSRILSGKGCPNCGQKVITAAITKTHNCFKQEVYKLVGGEYLLLGEYKGANAKIKMLHSVCGHEFSITPSSFLMGHRCHVCSTMRIANLRRKSAEQFKREIYKLVSSEYTILGKYISSKDKILIRHNTCGSEWSALPYAFFRGNRCPKCSESHGEKAVTKYLKGNCIYFKSQFRFIDCNDKRPLPFDFAIFNKNKLLALIEYDGEQHFKPIIHFGGEKQLNIQQRYDAIKTNYCLSRGIPLIRIPYTVTNVGNYLEIEISKLNESIQLTLTI